MSKKRKKANAHASQKLLRAQYRNIFYKQLQQLCWAIEGDNSLYNLIPERQKLAIYCLRGRSVKLKAAADVHIPAKLLHEVELCMNNVMANARMELVEGSGRTVSYADYCRIGMTIENLFELQSFRFPGKQKLEAFCNLNKQKRGDMYANYLETNINLLTFLVSDIKKKTLFTYSYHIHCDPTVESPDFLRIVAPEVRRTRSSEVETYADFTVHQDIIINKYTLEERVFNVRGERRIGIAIGTACSVIENDERKNKFSQITIPLSLFKPNSKMKDLLTPVYAQTHFINRLEERLCSPSQMDAVFVLLANLLTPEIIKTGDGEYLITCRMHDKKVGYARADLIDGCVLLRTFLFITNSGTPEGRRLEAQTGLVKKDRQYLIIDTLKGIVSSDILDNEAVRKLFENAGCGDLLDLCQLVKEKKVKLWIIKEDWQGSNRVAEWIMNFLDNARLEPQLTSLLYS